MEAADGVTPLGKSIMLHRAQIIDEALRYADDVSASPAEAVYRLLAESEATTPRGWVSVEAVRQAFGIPDETG